MASLNKIMLIGNCGRDCDLKYTASGAPIGNFSVAVNSNRKKPDGEWESETEWFNVTLFGDAAERLAQYITKGSSVFVEGKLRTRSWNDDQGQKHERTEVIADRVQTLDRKEAE